MGPRARHRGLVAPSYFTVHATADPRARGAAFVRVAAVVAATFTTAACSSQFASENAHCNLHGRNSRRPCSLQCTTCSPTRNLPRLLDAPGARTHARTIMTAEPPSSALGKFRRALFGAPRSVARPRHPPQDGARALPRLDRPRRRRAVVVVLRPRRGVPRARPAHRRSPCSSRSPPASPSSSSPAPTAASSSSSRPAAAATSSPPSCSAATPASSPAARSSSTTSSPSPSRSPRAATRSSACGGLAPFAGYKLPVEIAVLVVLIIMNLRGVKESVTALIPIFVIFCVTHLALIIGGIAMHGGRVPEVAHEVSSGAARRPEHARARRHGARLPARLLDGRRHLHRHRGGLERPADHARAARRDRQANDGVHGGLARLHRHRHHALLPALRGAPRRGADAQLRPRQRLRRRPGRSAASPSARASSTLTLASEGALLFVAAQTGFIDGPRVMANMAVDSLAAASLRLAVRSPDHEGRRAPHGPRRHRRARRHARRASTRSSSCTPSTSSSASRCRTSA